MISSEDTTILFVDDEPDILSSLKRFLRHEPYMKLFAESGKQALELIENHAVSIIISDLRMPEMNGLELIKQVKAVNQEIVRVILSGSHDIEQIIDSINTGEVFRFIPKPVDPNSFKMIINDAIEYYRLKKERDSLFKEISQKNLDLVEANTALQNMTGALRQSEEKFREMNDAAHDAVFMINGENEIVYRNTAAETVFGYKRNEKLNQSFLELLTSDHSGDDFLSASRDLSLNPAIKNNSRIYNLQGIRKNGNLIPLELSLGTVQIGNAPHTVVIARDITARVEAERSRERFESMQREFEAQIEKKLLQSPAPEFLDGATLNRLMISSGHLDGDFTDFIVYDSHHADILIGDVMGHGIQSALAGAGIKSLFLKALSQKKCNHHEPPELEDVVAEVHRLCIRELLELGIFATLSFLRLDLLKGFLSFIDCGHMPIIHFHAGTGSCSHLKGENLPMGMAEYEHYEKLTFPLNSNDLLILYSDGITESRSPEGTMFGIERLTDLVRENHDLPPSALTEYVKTAVSTFTEKSVIDDDFTCIVIRIDDQSMKAKPV
jgi:PAS domain S-box-containing protein